MWHEKILSLEPECTFSPPATVDQISEVAKILGVNFLPDSLKTLLLESNGVYGPYELGLIWSVETIQRRNLFMRTDRKYHDLYMPFDPLLFFADAGNGDLFAFPITFDKFTSENVFSWHHETDSRVWVAPTLEKYLEWWLQGIIKL